MLKYLAHVCNVQDDVTAQVNTLLALKKQYKELTGQDYTPAPASAAQQPKKDQVCIRRFRLSDYKQKSHFHLYVVEKSYVAFYRLT
jgi:WHEP-TRS domain